MMPGSDAIPRWDLSPIFPGFDSIEYVDAKKNLVSLVGEYHNHLASCDAAGDFSLWLKRAIEMTCRLGGIVQTLSSFAYANFSTDTRNRTTMAELNSIEELSLPLKRANVVFRNALASHRDRIGQLIASDPGIARYAFYLREEIFLQSRQMEPELEDLASDLQRSGADAWTRLHEQLVSSAGVFWDGTTRKTVVELRGMAHDPDRAVREKAWRMELQAWKDIEIPLASALNGVKGCTISLNKRRGWEGALEKSLQQSRMGRKTLDALIGAMEESLPVFRGYLRVKASALGLKILSFYDLAAPINASGRTYSFAQARDFIIEKFGCFSADMGDFAARAFGENWIDAQPREGKIGGAYCSAFPLAKVPRVFCNFDGSYAALSMVAHELGHAYHYELTKDLPLVLAEPPMTLAETASIFAETIVFEEALKTCSPEGKLGLLEARMQMGCQVIVDILSRFYFERAVFERRASGEIGPEEFSTLMLDAQKKTYGDALDPDRLHPYMWAVKGHYYNTELSFYNYPYSFGQLFGLGLYSKYREEGQAFVPAYRKLLAGTGLASAEELCISAGFDIQTRDFWRGGIQVFEESGQEFERLLKTTV